MKIQLDPEKLKKQAEAMNEAANYYEVILDNQRWQLKLPQVESLLLGDYISKYKLEKSGCTEEEYKKCSNIADLYYRITDFYDNKADEIRREISNGFERANIPFDVNLTKEEAFQKYCECDEEAARKAFDLVDKVNKAAAYHEKELRENYQGDLFAQLGRENDKPEYEERARAQQERIAKASEEFMKAFNSPENQERMQKGTEAANAYMEFVKKTGEEYEKQGQVQALYGPPKPPVPTPEPSTGYDPNKAEALKKYMDYVNEVADNYKELTGEDSGPKLS